MTETFWGILIPFLGTSLGAACVFFMRRALGDLVQRSLAGFAAGVMVAASVWSLLIPAIEQSEKLGRFAFFPAFAGFWFGVLFLLALDHLIPHLHVGSEEAEGPKSRLGRTTMMVLAVTLHNIPEGMAVGVMYAGFLAGSAQITAASALALSLGIAIQNFPEGAIISMPLRAEGESKGRAFAGGVLSGVVEPIEDKLLDLALAGALSNEEFRQRNEACNEQLAMLEQQRKELQNADKTLEQRIRRVESLRRTIEERWQTNCGFSREMSKALVDRIVVDADESRTCIRLEIFLTTGSGFRAEPVLAAAMQSPDAQMKLTFPRSRSGHQGEYSVTYLVRWHLG